MALWAAFWMILVLAGPAVRAQGPERSLRPDLRPDRAIAVHTAPASAAVATSPAVMAPPSARGLALSLRPLPRPRDGALAHSAPAQTGPRADPASDGRLAVARSVRPALRPSGLVERVTATAARTTSSRVAQLGQRGALCGQPGLEGERLDPIAGRARGCGIAEPVRLRVVDGVALSTPATVNCDTARALQSWVQQSVIPGVGRYGGGVRSLRVVASYACRTRNSQPGAGLSEHGRGNAIDIAGIGLADGRELTVLGDWRTRRGGRILRALHTGACGPFGTVLGPDADRFHRDHFHFDVARHRSGPFCR